ncbi:MAG: hypothetical protein AB7I42_24980 [Bradyrhizobium sp.]|uniref:hypothetical protein n=1 Tax=Bradyrhizobium sp. TaxID=376 RepID=UPI003D0D4E29
MMLVDHEMQGFDGAPSFKDAADLVAGLRGARPTDPLQRAMARQLKSLMAAAEQQWEARETARYNERVASNMLADIKAEIDALTAALTPPAKKVAA